jgi:co-chaperonin GroES (HSP10)
MTLKALQNCLIIKPDVEKHGLIELISTEKMETGIVVAAGPDCKELKVGDHLYFGVGQEFSVDGRNYVVMREPHVLGVLNG